MDGIEGKVAIVTGGASGLGAGLARAFVSAGVKVVVADVLGTAGERLQAELGGGCLFQATDLRSDDQLDALLDRVRAHFGGLDFLLNAACSYAENGLRSSRTEWQAVFDVNLFGHAVLMQKAVPLLAASTGASVVNLSSASAHIAQMGRWAYPASKAAIEQLTRSAALELAPHGIRVNALLPGIVGRPDGAPEAAERIQEMARQSTMLGRVQEADDVAQAALFLCSRHARFMTGSCLAVDGGYTALGPQGKALHLPRRR